VGTERDGRDSAAMPAQRPPVVEGCGPALEVGPLEAPQVGFRRPGTLAVEQLANAGRVPLVEGAAGLADIQDVGVAADLIKRGPQVLIGLPGLVALEHSIVAGAGRLPPPKARP